MISIKRLARLSGAMAFHCSVVSVMRPIDLSSEKVLTSTPATPRAIMEMSRCACWKSMPRAAAAAAVFWVRSRTFWMLAPAPRMGP